MKTNRKLLLAALFLMCLAPASFAGKPGKERDRGCDPKRDRRCQQVPEGGSAAIYLLGAGITCLGAIVIRSRSLSPNKS
jgi:hypothetical protein